MDFRLVRKEGGEASKNDVEITRNVQVKQGTSCGFPPAKSIDHGPNWEGADHPAHAEDGHGKTPHHGDGARAELLPVAVPRHILEKPTQFLSKRKKEIGLWLI